MNGLRQLAGPAAAAALLTIGCSGRSADTEAPQAAATSRVSGNVLERKDMDPTATTFLELIQGRLPGVTIRQRGADVFVEIRGRSSFSSNTEALIVIDGVEASSRVLLSINPSDVERVEVLKDAAAAMYGVRGANGVLVITTRR